MRTHLPLFLACALFTPCALVAQSTAFSYQGRLNTGGSPANGLYEMYFTLYDAVTNGNVVGTPVTVAPLPVTNGLFTATLDFGAGAFTGADRWLEIAVTVSGSDQPVVTLVPRQPITPTPYALHAANAAGLMSFANAPLDIKVDGERILRLEATGSGPNVIGGASVNGVAPDVIGATIGGGGTSSPGFEATNRVEANYGTISGGAANTIQALSRNSTIGGGWQNTIHADSGWSTIGGGSGNSSSGDATTVGGGLANVSSGQVATIGGGQHNLASGWAATIGGGEANTASGSIATIAGGSQNRILGNISSATIGGGYGNLASAGVATVGGGDNNVASGIYSTVAGGAINSATGRGAFIGGGGGEDEDGANFPNLASGRWSSVIAGAGNTASGDYATTGGGGFNRASGIGATVAGGGGLYFDGESAGNTAGARWSTVSGGALNAALGTNSTVGGGSYNVARGESATIPGGYGNNADGAYSFAAGENAFANHAGTFVWADASFVALHSATNNQFTARASGGVRFFTDTNATTGAELAPGSGTWSSLSDRNAKENFTAANAREILDKVAALPMASWNYKAQDKSVRHLGPMAQDFHAAFGLGESDRTITTVDADGVALAAIQGLNAKLEEELEAKDTRIAELERRLAGIEKLLATTTAK